MKNIKLNTKYKTLSGLKVNLIGLSPNPTYPVVGEVTDTDGSVFLERWTIDGRYESDFDSEYDLVEAPEIIKFSSAGYDIEVDRFGVCFSKKGFTKFVLPRTVFEKISEAYEKISE